VLPVTLENGHSLFLRVMLASELLGLDASEVDLPKPIALVKLDDMEGDKAEPMVTPSVTLHTAGTAQPCSCSQPISSVCNK